ncbi:putative hydrolase of the HAD superfamily [Luteimonas cucumeris]|uniref:Putative hydrolase of the HAD superfamily n=1 Tax=Luteimonas cucumeris TaxID=985012 RepID=A0A562LEX2_9GAMM|nr:HAD family phosphatase [Luteimonas cucumeris]TWI06164.1 putative hydrolase of the HAD superfamily [Luteimonas cucumeris]
MAVAPALVLFDLDGVLARYDRAARLAVLATRSGKTTEQVKAALFDSKLEDESDLGRWRPREYAQELSRRLGATVTLDDCIAARAASMAADQAALGLVHRIAERARVAILTNNGLFLRAHLPAMCPALFPLFSGHVHCSAEFGVAKPDPAIYRRCLAVLQTPPARALFVDDNPDNVRGAIEAGLDAIHYTHTAALAEAFASRQLTGAPLHAP